MSLLRAMLGDGTPRRSGSMSFDAYLALVQSSFSYGGSTYPIGLNQSYGGSKAEDIDGSFMSLASAAYRSNGIVFACEAVRLALFSEARFAFRRFENGQPGDKFTNAELAILEHPWPNGVTGDLLSRALLYADTAGNSFTVRRRNRRDRLRLPRPDWMTIVLGSYSDPNLDGTDLDAEVVGYMYHPGGRGSASKPEVLLPDEVAHFAPIPDPLASFRGMSWMTPIIREVQADGSGTQHRVRFFENAATPNMVVTLDKDITLQAYKEWKADFEKAEPRKLDAFKTLYLGGGATATVVGGNMQQLDFKAVQGAGETRIAAASGIHPVIAGLSEGLAGSSLNEGNFTSARRLVADRTFRPLWRNFAGSHEAIVPTPPASQLWYDDRDIAFLRDDAKDAAEIQGTESRAIRTLVDAGYTAESVVKAIEAQDWSLLKHSGLFSVQLQPPGTKITTPTAPPADAAPAA